MSALLDCRPATERGSRVAASPTRPAAPLDARANSVESERRGGSIELGDPFVLRKTTFMMAANPSRRVQSRAPEYAPAYWTFIGQDGRKLKWAPWAGPISMPLI